MSSTGWHNAYPLKFKCSFCNLYFRTEEEKNKHIEEKHRLLKLHFLPFHKMVVRA